MLQITKIFRFEMAHAINGYDGKCRHIHGHSYELHVTVAAKDGDDGFISPPGILWDFKEVKMLVQQEVINELDHSLVVSDDYLQVNEGLATGPNVYIWNHEPTAENLVVFIKNILQDKLPGGINLVRLKLFETSDSYAEWVAGCDCPLGLT